MQVGPQVPISHSQFEINWEEYNPSGMLLSEENQCSSSSMWKNKQARRLEIVEGWRHSDPGYKCWLLGIDVSTQMLSGSLSSYCYWSNKDCYAGISTIIGLTANPIVNFSSVVGNSTPSFLGQISRLTLPLATSPNAMQAWVSPMLASLLPWSGMTKATHLMLHGPRL